jgi:hypothetical protein
MSQRWPKSGMNHAAPYQISGVPFVTSSVASEVPGPDGNSVSLPVVVEFPFVTKFITIRNTGINELRVGFTPDGVIAPGERRSTVNTDQGGAAGRHYFLIPTGSSSVSGNHGNAGSSQTFDIRCKEIYFLSNAPKDNSPGAAEATSFSLLAGLTTIPGTEFPALTGSDGFVGIG